MKSVRCNCNNFRTGIAGLVFVMIVGVEVCLAGGAPTLSRTLPLVRTDGTTVGATQAAKLPKGTVSLSIDGQTQSFIIDAYNLTGPYDKGLAVYLGDNPQITNATLQYVSILDRTGTNNHWRLELISPSGAPAQLGVTNLTDLVGLTVFVASETNLAVLRANVTSLVPNPAKLSYRRRMPLLLPNLPLSPKAKGSVLVSYNGRTGASVVQIDTHGLNANNLYQENGVLSNCVANGIMAVNGKARWKNDTGRGDELYSFSIGDQVFYASDVYETTVIDEIGDLIVITDCFDGLHLWGTIPGPK